MLLIYTLSRNHLMRKSSRLCDVTWKLLPNKHLPVLKSTIKTLEKGFTFFKVNNKKIPEWRHWRRFTAFIYWIWTKVTPFCSISLVDINRVFLLDSCKRRVTNKSYATCVWLLFGSFVYVNNKKYFWKRAQK